MPTVRLLGPIDVVDGSGVVRAPKSPIRCTLLALLALEPGRVIGVEQLLDQAWDGTPPESGRRALRFHISRLRAELCTDDVIVTVGSGYRIDADTDLAVIDAAVASADADTARLGSLLALWRGDPFSGCNDATALEHERHRLAELHLTLAEEYYRRRLDEGDTTIVGDLTRLGLAHPMREDLWGLLITAHYRAGHQAAALRSYDRLRVTLRDELGVAPSPDLQRLERQILDHRPVDPGADEPTDRSHVRSGALPAEHARLIGRDGEVEDVRQHVEANRLVTVTGVGGVGKTSVVVAVAHQVADRGDREVWWCDLAPVDEDDVAFRIGQAIGLTSGTSDPDELGDALARRPPTLVVLDNCERVVESVAAVAEAVLDRSDASILATSRVPVAVADERSLLLAPLDPDTSATEMFVHAAANADPGAVASFDDDALRSICRRLDGIPLAIELVAARTRSMSLDDVTQHLDRLLDSPPARHAGHARHHTMTAAIETSVALLEPSMAAALGRLSVFAGGFDLDAADAILTGITEDPATCVEELVAQNLLTADTASGRTRYRLHEPIRQYAASRLWHDPAHTRDLHLEHYLTRLEDAHAALASTSCDPLVELVDHDLDNLAAVHDWALESDRVGDAIRLLRPLGATWIHEWRRPYRWADRTIDVAGIERHEGWGAVLPLALASAIGRYDFDRYQQLVERSVLVAEDDPGRDRTASALGWHALMFEHDHQLARRHLWESDRGDPYCRFARYYFGSLVPVFEAEARHDLDHDTAVSESIQIVEDGLRWARAIGARNFEAALLQQLAQLRLRGGMVEEAVAPARRAVELGHLSGTAWAEQASQSHLVEAAILGAEIDGTIESRLTEAIETGIRQGAGARLGYVLKSASRPLAARGEHLVAAMCFDIQTLGRFDLLPRLALDDIAAETWRAAAAEAEHLTIFDIARRAVDALRGVPTAVPDDAP